MFINEMKKELRTAAGSAKKWFASKATEKDRKTYFARGKLGDSGIGAVYVYSKNEEALYVGQSGRHIKRRMHDQTSPHKKKKWWKEWDKVAFLNIKNRTDRLTLELLLILSLQPKYNVKPEARKISEMYKT
jgi:hypothetical protein